MGPPEGRRIVGGEIPGGQDSFYCRGQIAMVHSLALFAYPLYPPSQDDQTRDKHFPGVGVPTLFCSGPRDAFGTTGELQAASSEVEGSRLHLLEEADHGFATLKSAWRCKAEVWEETTSGLTDWLNGLFPR